MVSQLQSVRGFAIDGSHDEAMAPVATESKKHIDLFIHNFTIEYGFVCKKS